MKQKQLAELTDEELLEEAKKMKSTSIINAVIVGFMIGIIIYSIVQNSLWLFTLIPLFFAYKLVSTCPEYRENFGVVAWLRCKIGALLDLYLPEVMIFWKSALVLRSNMLRADNEPGEDHHRCFWDSDRLVGNESSREHDEIVGKHRTVHIGFEVIESFPVTAWQAEASFQIRDHRFDAGSEAPQFVVQPSVAGHCFHRQADALVESHVCNA